MTRWLNSLQPWGVVLLRYVLGGSMLYHGWTKVNPIAALHGHDLLSGVNHFSHSVASMGLPFWLGYVALFAELVGGAALIVGLFVRFFAFLIACDMVVAVFLVTSHRGYSVSELPIALLAIAVMLLLTGPGRWALDRRMGFI